jgi:hypothetical protein
MHCIRREGDNPLSLPFTAYSPLAGKLPTVDRFLELKH